ncbi:GDP-mannose 4,6-dehydratase [Sphingobium sp. RSMS]|uniref:GDP-mannose 4,6-dehydratase n=1 Tax=Sphingobium sp. RSMS TaxID=520734 RepID=UPI0010F68423|nr:GDP-mannose 4,6-dehydratase [Sphingobium sp. RSMS]UXC92649.1 GDP-mannose 4,6-dehydratase [Sphingobium sp. RSMS]
MITGAGGMMGSHLAEVLRGEGTQVLPTFFQPTINMGTVDPAISFTPLDVCDREAVRDFIRQHRPSEIYHLAAQSLPTVSWTDPWRTARTNIEGTINIFEAIKEIRAEDAGYDPMTVVACSSAEYGASLTPDRVPVTEDAPLLPLHPYGVSKVGQDLLAFQYFYNHELRCVRARIFNCTGPRKRNDVVSDFGRAIVKAMKEGAPVRHGNLETQRAIIDVRDMVRALIALARRGTAGDAYNICAEKAFRISEVLEMYFEAAGQRFPAEVDPALLRPSDEPIIFGDIAKIKRDTGWAPTIDIRQTIADVLAFEKDQYERHTA